jgi:hypothetical protein
MKVATQHAETHSKASRQGMEKWFFFDRIVMESSGIVERNSQYSFTIMTDFADPALTRLQPAQMPASGANENTGGKRLDQLAGTCEVVDGMFEGYCH